MDRLTGLAGHVAEHRPSGEILRARMLALVIELTPRGQRRALALRLGQSIGRIDFEAWERGSQSATVTLVGESMHFLCDEGVHGRLYPDFHLDDGSLTKSAAGRPFDLVAVLHTLRDCFRRADDVRLVDEADDVDEESFVVDPETDEQLDQVHHT